MLRDRPKLLLLPTGVAIATVGVLLHLTMPVGRNYRLSEPAAKSLTLEEVIGPPGPADWGTIKADLDVAIDLPQDVQTGDGFVVALTATVRQMTFVPHIPSQIRQEFERDLDLLDPIPAGRAIPPPEFSPDELRDFIHQRMKRGEIAFVLSLAGAKVEPTGKNAVSEKGNTHWSVKPEGPGLLRGFIKPDFLRSSGGHSGEHRVEYSAAEYIPVNVTSVEPIITTKSVLSATVTFLGTLLTLPGILAFLEKRRRKRKEQDAEQQRQRPKIILPNDRRFDHKDET